MRRWRVNDRDVLESAGLTRSFTDHLRRGSQMTLDEFVRSMNLVFSYCSSEAECFEAYLNAGSLLFCDTAESEASGFRPFAKPLGRMWREEKTRIGNEHYDHGRASGRLSGEVESIK